MSLKRRVRLHNERVLWPEHKGLDEVLELRRTTPAVIFETTWQGRDSVSTGTVFQRSWWGYWQPQGMNLPRIEEVTVDSEVVERPLITLPATWSKQVQSWDFSFTESKGSAYNVGQVWGMHGANTFLISQVRGHWTMPQAVDQVKRLHRNYPHAAPILIENKANGPAIIQTLRSIVPGIFAIEPKGDKVQRAHAITPFVQAGNVYLPHPHMQPWVVGFVDELSVFPGGEYADQTDTCTQALQYFYKAPAKKKQTDSRTTSMATY